MEKTLPVNLDVEKCVLGSLVIDPEGIGQITDMLKPEDFYRDAHRTMYRAILSLYAQELPADSVTLADELERKGELEGVGGFSCIASLVNVVPTSGNLEYYAKIVARDAECRRLIHAAGQIAALAYDRADNALMAAEQILFTVGKRASVSGFKHLQEVMDEYMHELERVHEKRGTIIGIPTGFAEIDHLLGGLQRSDLVVLAGRPSMGKSAVAMGMAYQASMRGHGVAVFSLEMGRKQLALRLMAMRSGIDMQSLRNGWLEDEDWSTIIEARDGLDELPIWINDTSGNPILSMRSQLRRLMAEHPIDLIVVDYLQLIEPPDDKRKHDTRVNEIGEITRGLKGMAKEFDVPVLALAQLSRAVESRASKIPQLSDLRESGSIENDADVVMMIYRQDYYDEREEKPDAERTRRNEADIIIEKHRNGPTDTVTLYYRPEQTRFYNMEGKHA